jgi:hypothetical protein
MAIFSAAFTAIAVSAAQDLFEIVGPVNSRVAINEIRFAQYSDFGDAQSELLSVLLMRGHTTAGTGGSPLTPANLHGYANVRSAGAAVSRNNTTLAQDGSPETLLADAWNVMAPYLYLPKRSIIPQEDERFTLAPSQRLVVRITAPADALTMNGTILFEELGKTA